MDRLSLGIVCFGVGLIIGMLLGGLYRGRK